MKIKNLYILKLYFSYDYIGVFYVYLLWKNTQNNDYNSNPSTRADIQDEQVSSNLEN